MQELNYTMPEVPITLQKCVLNEVSQSRDKVGCISCTAVKKKTINTDLYAGGGTSKQYAPTKTESEK